MRKRNNRAFPIKKNKEVKLIILNHIFGFQGMSKQRSNDDFHRYVALLQRREDLKIEGYKFLHFFTETDSFRGTKVEVLHSDILSMLNDLADDNGKIDYNILQRKLKIENLI